MPARKTTAEILNDLYQARDNVIDAMVPGAGVTQLEIRGKVVRRDKFEETLMEIERLISFYEAKGSGKQTGPVRTQAAIRYQK